MKNIISLAILLFLTACTTMQSPSSTMTGASTQTHYLTWRQRQTQIAQIQNWQINGAMGLKAAEKGFNGPFTWQQRQDNYALQMFGPLGVSSVRLIGSPNQVTLQTANNRTFTASDPESLLMQQMGWQLPVSNLYYWVRGIPAPDSAARAHLDSMNHLTRLEQQGWQIEYGDYQSVNRVDLPSKITLVNSQVRVRIVIKHWGIA